MIGEFEGVEIEVAGVVIWPTEVDVRLAARPSERSRQVDADFERAVANWRARRDESDDEPFPVSPSRALFLGRRPRLSDDLGTKYDWTSGGSWGWQDDEGTHWGITHLFVPSPPRNAKWLEIMVDLDQTAATRVGL